MGTGKWKRHIRVTGSYGSILRFHGIEIASIDSNDWVLDMDALLDELYTLERAIALHNARVEAKAYTDEPFTNEDWYPPKQLQRNMIIFVINELPFYFFPEFPLDSRPDDVKWHKLDTSRCTEITVDPVNANTSVRVY